MWNKCLRLFWLGKRTDLIGEGMPSPYSVGLKEIL